MLKIKWPFSFLEEEEKKRAESEPQSAGISWGITDDDEEEVEVMHSRPSFSLFDSKQMFNINKFLPMTGFEPRTSGIGSNHSTNWATTTAQDIFVDIKNSQPSGQITDA